jgi:predicted PurR-regulated permease PerM
MTSATSPANPHQGLPRLFYAVALIVLTGILIYVGRAVIIPLIISVFLSFLIVSLQRMIEGTPVVGRILPDWLSLILSFALIAAVLILLVQIIIGNGEAMLRELPAYRARFIGIFGSIEAFLRQYAFLDAFLDNVLTELDMSDVGTRIVTFIGGYADEAGAAIRSFGANLVTILLYTSFMLIERGKFLKKLGLIAAQDHNRLDVDQIISDIGDLVRQYISIKTLTSFIVAFISWIIMTILGIDFAGFWALLIFSLNFIPIIGSVIAVIMPSLLALVQPDGGGVTLFLLTLGLLTLAEQAVGSIVEPRLLGRSLNLSPLVILLTLSVWGSLWGFAGMLLCVPMTVAVMIMLSQFEDFRPVAIMLSDNGEISPIKRKQHDDEAEAAS